ncbi:MAG: hypothetical protein J7578_08615 [Chitinophagaceae bacterium]|nr:hypothetical protein [Chitinophagaceae bacterium]
MVLTKKIIDAYLNEFREVTGEEVPVRALEYFNGKQYEALHEKDITSELDGYGMDEDAILEMDIEKMTMLIDFSNDGYFDEDNKYLPLASINDQTCYIGIMAGDPSHKVYFFDYQEGFTEQEYSLDELLKKFK